MKKIIITLGILALPLTYVGAYQVIKNYASSDYIANIQHDSGNTFIYKVEDSSDPNVKCYVASRDFNVLRESKGNSTSISCISVVKK